jgi:hypothetical protein
VRTRGRRIGALRWANELKEKAPVILVCRGSADGLFPLTPAISPQERASRRQRLSEFEALRLAARPWAILPLPWGCAFPTSFPFPAQSRRDCVLQPRVASRELPWVNWASRLQPQRGCGFKRGPEAATPLGLAAADSLSQGSSRLATLGFETESLWDSPGPRCELWGMLSPRRDGRGEGKRDAGMRQTHEHCKLLRVRGVD